MSSWEICIREGNVRKSRPDTELARSLVQMSEKRLKFLGMQEPDEDNSSILMAEYYEAMREVCEAILAVRGFK